MSHAGARGAKRRNIRQCSEGRLRLSYVTWQTTVTIALATPYIWLRYFLFA
jgi:hypothetical protein